VQDITERHAIEAEKEEQRKQLLRSNADLLAFAYSASHDLKAPLRAITHLAGWISQDLATTASPETLEHLELLQGRARRLQALLDGLLAYSRIGRGESDAEDLNLADIVEDILAVAPPPPGFVVVCEGTMPTIRVMRTPLRVVLDNLIANSLKHHDRAEGRVTIAMRRADGLVEIRVSDDGPGIPAQFHDRVFEIFQTLASRDRVESSGMGLAIVKKMIEVHGGRVWIESAPPERGTTVAFTWKEEPR
jgi:signal transduction histidine kinase